MHHNLTETRPEYLVAQCRSRTGGYVELPVLDISPGGCLVDRRAWSAKPDERILIRLKGLSFQPGIVLWVEDDRAGIAFEQPLYEAVMDHLRLSIPQKLAS